MRPALPLRLLVPVAAFAASGCLLETQSCTLIGCDDGVQITWSGASSSDHGVLTLDGGRRVFVKAGGPALPHVVTALAREADVLPQLGELNCAPRLLGSSAIQTRGEGDWRVLVRT